jgi:hypothetical protein
VPALPTEETLCGFRGEHPDIKLGGASTSGVEMKGPGFLQRTVSDDSDMAGPEQATARNSRYLLSHMLSHLLSHFYIVYKCVAYEIMEPPPNRSPQPTRPVSVPGPVHSSSGPGRFFPDPSPFSAGRLFTPGIAGNAGCESSFSRFRASDSLSSR